jgi:site-specific recombinase XerC
MDRYREPRGPFEAGRKKVGLEWVGFHDLRHFRASQWIMKGVDLRTVQELMGHRDIKTTIRPLRTATCLAQHSGSAKTRGRRTRRTPGQKQDNSIRRFRGRAA